MKRIHPLFRALSGIAHAFRSRITLRIHITIAVAVVTAGFYFHVSELEWCILLVCIGAVITAELFNTSLPRRLKQELPTTMEANQVPFDIAAGAMLVVCLMTAVIGCIIFIPYISEYLS
ncbi:MAG: diacylglycerol kinase [Bacteroidota bacterium]|jgi:diacylglycerol kinase